MGLLAGLREGWGEVFGPSKGPRAYMVTCDRCNGTGKGGIEGRCTQCQGAGRWDPKYPPSSRIIVGAPPRSVRELDDRIRDERRIKRPGES